MYLLVLLFVLIGSLHHRRSEPDNPRSVETHAAVVLTTIAFTIIAVGTLPIRLPSRLEHLPCLSCGMCRFGSFVFPNTEDDSESDHEEDKTKH